GGTITLAATLARVHVFEAFWSDDHQKALMHGPTYMANPLACSAANASLDLFESEPRLEQAQRVEFALKRDLEPCRDLPRVIDVRVLGAIGVVQFNSQLDHARVRTSLLAQGVWIRTLTDCIYLTPALNIQDAELRALTDAVVATANR
ncbi:MAG: adenosylmethionine-8-amino-7-oxononanoate aminotransferase, partial [Gammaproteobacteria bacterium]